MILQVIATETCLFNAKKELRKGGGSIASSTRTTHLAFLDMNVPELSALDNLEAHVTLPHVEELFAFLEVIIFPLVRTANIKYLKSTILLFSRQTQKYD